MVDKIRFLLEGSIQYWLELLSDILEKNGKKFTVNKNEYGDITSYLFIDDLGLRLTINSKGLTIENSFHKTYNRLKNIEGNFNYFGYEELCEIINYLSKKYRFNTTDAKIKKIELGVNVVTNFTPKDYIDKVLTFMYVKDFDKMRSKHTIYGRKFFLSQYNLKLYDKSLQHYLTTREKLNENIIRFEVEIHKTSCINKHLNVLSDLMDIDKYVELTNYVHEKFSNLQFKYDYDLSDLSCKQLELYYSGRELKYWKELSNRNKSTFATKKRRYNILINSVEKQQSKEKSLVLELKNKMRKAIYDLYNKTTCYTAEKHIQKCKN